MFPVSIIKISLASDSIIGFNGIDAVAIGLQSDSSDFVSYKWSTGSENKFVELSQIGSYYVTVTDDLGGEYIDSIEVKNPSLSPPDIAIAGSAAQDTSVCYGVSLVLSSNKSEGNTWNTNEFSDSIIVDTAGMYYLTYDDESTCGLQMSDTITISIDTLPQPEITGSFIICENIGSTELRVSSIYENYSWSNGTMSSIAAELDVTVADSYSVTVTDSHGCMGSTDAEVTAPIQIAPDISIDGSSIHDTTFCSGRQYNT